MSRLRRGTAVVVCEPEHITYGTLVGRADGGWIVRQAWTLRRLWEPAEWLVPMPSLIEARRETTQLCRALEGFGA